MMQAPRRSLNEARSASRVVRSLAMCLAACVVGAFLAPAHSIYLATAALAFAIAAIVMK